MTVLFVGVAAMLVIWDLYVCSTVLFIFVCHRTQLAYVQQKLGQNEPAMKLYNQVMKQRWTIILLILVCSISVHLN